MFLQLIPMMIFALFPSCSYGLSMVQSPSSTNVAGRLKTVELEHAGAVCLCLRDEVAFPIVSSSSRIVFAESCVNVIVRVFPGDVNEQILCVKGCGCFEVVVD